MALLCSFAVSLTHADLRMHGCTDLLLLWGEAMVAARGRTSHEARPGRVGAAPAAQPAASPRSQRRYGEPISRVRDLHCTRLGTSEYHTLCRALSSCSTRWLPVSHRSGAAPVAAAGATGARTVAAAFAAGRGQAAAGEAAIAAGVIVPLDDEEFGLKGNTYEHPVGLVPHTAWKQHLFGSQQTAAARSHGSVLHMSQRLTSLSGINSGLAYLHSVPCERSQPHKTVLKACRT